MSRYLKNALMHFSLFQKLTVDGSTFTLYQYIAYRLQPDLEPCISVTNKQICIQKHTSLEHDRVTKTETSSFSFLESPDNQNLTSNFLW